MVVEYWLFVVVMCDGRLVYLGDVVVVSEGVEDCYVSGFYNVCLVVLLIVSC